MRQILRLLCVTATMESAYAAAQSKILKITCSENEKGQQPSLLVLRGNIIGQPVNVSGFHCAFLGDGGSPSCVLADYSVTFDAESIEEPFGVLAGKATIIGGTPGSTKHKLVIDGASNSAVGSYNGKPQAIEYRCYVRIGEGRML